jgi:hypothetical protein
MIHIITYRLAAALLSEREMIEDAEEVTEVYA